MIWGWKSSALLLPWLFVFLSEGCRVDDHFLLHPVKRHYSLLPGCEISHSSVDTASLQTGEEDGRACARCTEAKPSDHS